MAKKNLEGLSFKNILLRLEPTIFLAIFSSACLFQKYSIKIRTNHHFCSEWLLCQFQKYSIKIRTKKTLIIYSNDLEFQKYSIKIRTGGIKIEGQDKWLFQKYSIKIRTRKGDEVR